MKAVFPAAAVAALLIAGSVQAAPIDVQVNGERVDFPYAQPTEVAGRVMIPLRGVLDRLGADRIDWRPARQEVIVAGPSGDMRLRIGDRTAVVDGRDVPLDVPPMILRGTTMVPLRFISENLGARIDWLPDQQTVYIATPGQRVAGYRSRISTEERTTREERYSTDERDNTARQPLPRRVTEPRARAADVVGLFPRQGATVDDPRAQIFARFRPNAPVDFNSVRLFVNGRNVTRDAEITTEGVRFDPADDLPRGRNDVRLTFRDTRGVLSTRQWYFFTP
jgi:hypothetical protein